MKLKTTYILLSLMAGIHLSPHSVFAQISDSIQLPVIHPPQYRVYIDTAGVDQNSGDSVHPVLTFTAALDKLDSLTIGLTDDVYAEVVFYAGTYAFAATQPVNKYQIGAKRLNVSVRGKGIVNLDGNGLLLNTGNAMISLKGSHIKVQNFKVLYSSANGVNFGWNYLGTIINSHDIVVENVEVQQTSGHGIIGGIGRLNTSNSTQQIPYGERFLIKNCHVHDAVNYNDHSALQWGSSIKLLNVKHATIQQCLVHDNGGEGLAMDFAHHVLVQDNTVYDNRANIYMDKAEYCIIRNNLNYYDQRSETGILMSMEVISSLINTYIVRDVSIYNNVILNAKSGISFWQGTVSAIQSANFINIDIRNNTIVGKQLEQGGAIQFTYVTSFGQPAGNIHFSKLNFHNNIVSVHPDSLSGNLVSGPLNPQPALSHSFNLWSQHPGIAYSTQTDRIDSLLPFTCQPNDLSILIPHRDSNKLLVMAAPRDTLVSVDYRYELRYPDSSNVGAFEVDTTESIDTTTLGINLLSNSDITVLPNPFSTTALVKSKSIDFRHAAIFLYDQSGRQVDFEYSVQDSALLIQKSRLQSGLYLLNIHSNTDVIIIKLMVY